MCDPLYFLWDESCNLDIPLLDEQHRSIVSMINTLHHFVRLGKSESIIDAVLNTLDQQTSIHFTTEEQLLLKSGYPDLNKHISSHRRLLQTTTRILSADGSFQGEEILHYLKDWWLNHINREDREFVPYLLEADRREAVHRSEGKWCRLSWQEA